MSHTLKHGGNIDTKDITSASLRHGAILLAVLVVATITTSQNSTANCLWRRYQDAHTTDRETCLVCAWTQQLLARNVSAACNDVRPRAVSYTTVVPWYVHKTSTCINNTALHGRQSHDDPQLSNPLTVRETTSLPRCCYRNRRRSNQLVTATVVLLAAWQLHRHVAA